MTNPGMTLVFILLAVNAALVMFLIIHDVRHHIRYRRDVRCRLGLPK